jgi:hypothetical protein
MTEPNLSGGGPDLASALICPWCSAALKTGREETCPSCGASLHEAAESEVPGVTSVDHEAILKGRAPGQKGRGLIGWLSGEYEAEAAADTPESIAPPDEAVRREMLRLELAALEAEVQGRRAEADAERVDARIEGGDRAPEGAEPGDYVVPTDADVEASTIVTAEAAGDEAAPPTGGSASPG